jgi:hypothetical protein
VSPSKNLRVIKLAGLIVLTCLVLIYAGGLVLGFAATASAFLVRLLEFIGVVGLPVAGGAVLAWFAYKLLLQPVFRQRKLNRIREHRALRNPHDRD